MDNFNMSEWVQNQHLKEARIREFDNDDWIKILQKEQDKNLIFKFRKKQIEITLRKIFN